MSLELALSEALIPSSLGREDQAGESVRSQIDSNPRNSESEMTKKIKV